MLVTVSTGRCAVKSPPTRYTIRRRSTRSCCSYLELNKIEGWAKPRLYMLCNLAASPPFRDVDS